MELVILAVLTANTVLSGIAALFAARNRVEVTVETDPDVPPMGTVARKEYHREQRDYHTQMVIEAGRAARQSRGS